MSDTGMNLTVTMPGRLADEVFIFSLKDAGLNRHQQQQRQQDAARFIQNLGKLCPQCGQLLNPGAGQ